MKYKLLKELPFMRKGSIFGKGCWVGGGWGVDRGETHYSTGGSSHNGTIVFDNMENRFLDRLVKGKHYSGWIKELNNY
jgi:hypothetical protein